MKLINNILIFFGLKNLYCNKCNKIIPKNKIKELYWSGHYRKPKFCDGDYCDWLDMNNDKCGCEFCKRTYSQICNEINNL